jgi:hypothetical protein
MEGESCPIGQSYAKDEGRQTARAARARVAPTQTWVMMPTMGRSFASAAENKKVAAKSKIGQKARCMFMMVDPDRRECQGIFSQTQCWRAEVSESDEEY